MASTTESRIKAARKAKAVDEARDRLRDAIKSMDNGYAEDVATSVLEDPATCTLLECGDLFRTLVLDNGWNVPAASGAYYAATTLVEHACPSNA